MDFLTTCICWLTVSTASLHFDSNGLNQYNPGIGIEVNGWVAGEYRNSLDRPSAYIGRAFSAARQAWRGGVTLGAVTGYQRQSYSYQAEVFVPPKTNPNGTLSSAGLLRVTEHVEISGSPGAVAPLAAPFIAFEADRLGINLVLLPDAWRISRSAVALQVKWRVK